MSTTDFVLSIAASIIATILLIPITFWISLGVNNYRKNRKKPPLNKAKISIFLFVLTIIIVLAIYTFIDLENQLITENRTLILLCVLTTLSIGEVIQLLILILKYERIGIVNIDKTTIKGFNYKQSLQAVTSDLNFIGVGSSKLTKNIDDFTEMVKRVNNSGKEVQLILCNPQSESLIELAKRANIDSKSYSKTVIDSLRIIKDIKSQDFRIKVRLYRSKTIDEMPVFRVMIINRNHCLIAYSHFNDSSHKGQILPQLHLRKLDDDTINNLSLFTAFQKHFKQTWDGLEKEEWNYEDYL